MGVSQRLWVLLAAITSVTADDEFSVFADNECSGLPAETCRVQNLGRCVFNFVNNKCQIVACIRIDDMEYCDERPDCYHVAGDEGDICLKVLPPDLTPDPAVDEWCRTSFERMRKCEAEAPKCFWDGFKCLGDPFYTIQPTVAPSLSPTDDPTANPTPNPTLSPTDSPTKSPTLNPTPNPTASPTDSPTLNPTASPTRNPTASPTKSPSSAPSSAPTNPPSRPPTPAPTREPSWAPSRKPTWAPSFPPTFPPTPEKTEEPTMKPTNEPTFAPFEGSQTEASSEASAESEASEPSSEPSGEPSEDSVETGSQEASASDSSEEEGAKPECGRMRKRLCINTDCCDWDESNKICNPVECFGGVGDGDDPCNGLKPKTKCLGGYGGNICKWTRSFLDTDEPFRACSSRDPKQKTPDNKNHSSKSTCSTRTAKQCMGTDKCLYSAKTKRCAKALRGKRFGNRKKYMRFVEERPDRNYCVAAGGEWIKDAPAGGICTINDLVCSRIMNSQICEAAGCTMVAHLCVESEKG